MLENARRLGDAHNVLIEVLGKHEVFLPDSVTTLIGALARTVRLELSHIQHHERFGGSWWDEGEANQLAFKATCDELRALVRLRTAQLRAETAVTEDLQ